MEISRTLINLVKAYHTDFVTQHKIQDFPSLIDVLAMISTESSWDIYADSKFARGLMQISEPALRTINNLYGTRFTYDDMFDAWKNIWVGIRYMRWLYRYLTTTQKISSNIAVPYTIMAYNWGIGNFARWLRETKACNTVIDEKVPLETKNHLVDWLWWWDYWQRRMKT